jgi:hypothetical protein
MQPTDLPPQGGDDGLTTPNPGYAGDSASDATYFSDNAPTSSDLPAQPAGTPPPPASAPPATTGKGGPTPRLLLLAGVAAVVVLALIASAVAFARGLINQTPTPGAILSSAENAHLTDASYAIADQLTLVYTSSSSGGAPTTLDMTGTGKLTKSPARNDVTLSIPLLGAQNTVEVITDGTDVYVNIGALADLLGGSGVNVPKGKWVKVPVGMAIPTVLDYSHLTNLKLIGAETINGKATWHIQGTLSVHTGSGTTTANPGASATATAVATQYGLSVPPVTEDLWFQQGTYYPAKFVVTFSASATKAPSFGGAAGGTGPAHVTNTATLTFNAWNTGATITVPSPSQVVSLPAGSFGSGA